MMRHSRPLWPLVMVVLVGLPALSVASIGPVVWIFAHTSPPDWFRTVTDFVYEPLERVGRNAPEPLKAVMWWYLDLWGWNL